MKRIVPLGVCLLWLFVAGCSQPNIETDVFCAKNEIFTYDRPEKGKTILTLGKVGAINLQPMVDAFMEANPDIQIIMLDITGGNQWERPWVDWMNQGYRPDLMMISFLLSNNVPMQDYFEDLTANPVLNRYQSSHLTQCAVDGKVYALPSPSSLTTMHYNKTLFAQYGWNVPQSFEEFLALCDQITRDTQGTICPWKPNAKYSNAFIPSLQGFLYGERFAGVENRTWYNEFLKGNVTFSEHMQPAYEIVDQLIAHGLLTEADFSYSATQLFEEFRTGQIAMLACSTNNKFPEEDHVFDLMPYPSTDGKAGFMMENLSYCIAKPIKEQSKEKEDALQRLLAFFSTKEAQDIYTYHSVMVSSLVDNNDAIRNLPPALYQAQEEGRIFSVMNFNPPNAPADYSAFSILQEDILAVVKGEMLTEDAMAHFDEQHKNILQGTESKPPAVLAQAKEDFTILQTSEYFADMFRETTGADVALMLNNSAYRGNLMRMFAGDITESTLSNLILRSLENDSHLQKVRMTGRQLLDVLNDAMYNETAIRESVYAVSGLHCTVAPWHPMGEKVQSVTLPDGTAIEENKIYTVAAWEGTIREDYIQAVEQTYEGKFIDHLRESILSNSPIAPSYDQRMTLIWD